MSNGHRWSKFWWQDWQGDAALRACSLAAQGLWMRLLCIAHEGTPTGHVTINGKAPNIRQLAAIVGATEREVSKLLAELDDAGVYSKADDGTIYNRRMVADAASSEEGRQHIAKRWGSNGAAHPNRGAIRSPTSKPNWEATSDPTSLEADSDSEAKEEKQEIDITCFSYQFPAPVRELEAAAAGVEAPDGFVTPVEERVSPAYVEAQVGRLAHDLRHIAYAAGWSARLSRDEQIETLKPSRPKALPLVGDALVEFRRAGKMIH